MYAIVALHFIIEAYEYEYVFNKEYIDLKLNY